MNDALASQEERHKVELKKAIDKQTASEKIKKDRWVDLKTKKIKVIRYFYLNCCVLYWKLKHKRIYVCS
jgi:hypothetical protein